MEAALVGLLGVLLGGGITWFLERDRRRAEDQRRLYDQKWETFASFISTGDLVVSNLRAVSKLAQSDRLNPEYVEAIAKTIPSLDEFMAQRDRLEDLYNRLTLICGERVSGVLWFYLINTEEAYGELLSMTDLPTVKRGDPSVVSDSTEQDKAYTSASAERVSDTKLPDDRLELLFSHHRQLRRAVRVAARHELSGEPDENLDVEGLMASALEADPEAKYIWGEKTIE